MDNKLNEISSDVKEIKSVVNRLSEQAAVHNHILNEHHKRSTNLEQSVKPLQLDYAFRTKLWSIFLGSSGLTALAAIVIAVLSYLK